MLSFIFQQLLFYISIFLVLFVPGYFLMLAVFGNKKTFTVLEKFIISFASSLIVIDFLMIAIGKIGIPINRFSLIAVLILFSGACHLIFKFRTKKDNYTEKNIAEKQFSKRQLIAIIAILFLTIFIKTVYLKDAILPSSTDLGHHMYWTKIVDATGKLPDYKEINIDLSGNLTKLLPIADFIIGEHLPFAAIGIVSGVDYVSYFPALVLYLIHIMGILTMFSLALLLFRDSAHKNKIAIVTLFLAGPVFALSSPQTKFVSGGVVGNTIGNFLIPLVIYFFVRALSEKSSKLLAYATFLILGLIYTHHLSTFVFIFVFIFSLIFFTAFNIKQLPFHAREWFKMIFSKQVLSVLALGAVLIVLFYTPTYLNKTAVDTAVGTPLKATRTGLTLTQLKFAVGEARMAFGIIGVAILLFFTKKRSTYAGVFLLGWFFATVLMSLRPDLLFIDVPSNRIADYAPFPVTLLASFGFVSIVAYLKTSGRQYLRSSLLFSLFILFLTFIATSGFYDNSQTLNADSNPTKILETYDASQYLSKVTTDTDMILKDHNYLSADSWIKLYFMRGYNYPLSRGYFKRYDDPTKQREQCTNIMIATPAAPDAQKCFEATKTNFLMVSPKMDKVQFQKSEQFWHVYSADDISIFYKAQ